MKSLFASSVYLPTLMAPLLRSIFIFSRFLYSSAAFFYTWLNESCIDFRVTSGFLSNIRYAVFGLGNSIYEENFNKIGKKIDELLQVGGAQRILQMGTGDDNSERQKGTQENDFVTWKSMLLEILPSVELAKKEETCACCQPSNDKENGGCCQSNDDACCQNKQTEEEFASDYESDEEQAPVDEELLDVEDLGVIKSKPAATTGKREMVTPEIRQSLTKQGYRVLGSHSGVKICRWNKVDLLHFYSFNTGHVARSRRLLQTYFLWNQIILLYGNDSQFSLRQ